MNISLIGWSHLGSLIVKNLRQPWHMRLFKEQSFIFYSVISSITDDFLFTAGWTSYPNSTLFNILLLCFLYFLFSFLFRYPFKQSTLLWKTSQIVCIQFKTRLFSYGYGIRYEYGIFTQKIKGTEQVSVLWFCFLTPFFKLDEHFTIHIYCIDYVL